MKVKTIRICLVYVTPCKINFFSIYDHRDFKQKIPYFVLLLARLVWEHCNWCHE